MMFASPVSNPCTNPVFPQSTVPARVVVVLVEMTVLVVVCGRVVVVLVEMTVLVVVGGRVVDVDVLVDVVVTPTGSVNSFENALSVPSLAYAETVKACPTAASSPPTSERMVPSPARVGIPALMGAP